MQILTIFGAGASYDSRSPHGVVRNGDARPPLTDNLFENRPYVNDLVALYPSLGSCLPEIRAALAQHKLSLEAILNEFWENAQGKPYRMNQISEASRYIAHYFKKASQEYISSGSNYDWYLNVLADHGVKSDIFTFNYDTLLESAFKNVHGASFGGIDAYVMSGCTLVKVHGSWNWYRGSDGFIFVGERKGSIIDEDVCIGLPVTPGKTIVCPQEHLLASLRHLKEVCTIVSIGWRGKEPHFFEELEKFGSRAMKIRLIVVSNSYEGCTEVHANFSPHFRSIDFVAFSNGFSGLLVNDIKKFLSFLM